MNYLSVKSKEKKINQDNIILSNPTELNYTIKNILEFKSFAKNSYLKGNVINIRIAQNITYFTLKDTESQISCIHFGALKLENDQEYIIQGNLQIYAPKGTYTINVTDAYKSYQSIAKLNYNKVKKILERQNKHSRCRDIKKIPKKIGIITSKDSDAENDILEILKAKIPAIILIYYVPVQGKNLEQELIEAIKKLNNHKCDVIGISRGGGSYEDLDAFNKESIANMILNSEAVVCTGIGHHKDITIADYIADKNFGTPSTLAQNLLPSKSEIKNQLSTYDDKLNQSMINKIQNSTHLLQTQKNTLKTIFISKIHEFEIKINKLYNKIERYNYQRALDQGYTLTLKNGLLLQEFDKEDDIITVTKTQKISSKINKIQKVKK